MTAGETELEMAVRHVAEQENRIARQKVLTERLRKVGAPPDDALGLLTSIARTLKNDAGSRSAAFKLGHYPRLLALGEIPAGPKVIGFGESDERRQMSAELRSCSREVAAAAALWGFEHLLAVAKRYRRRSRTALAVLWVGERCGEIAGRMLAAR